MQISIAGSYLDYQDDEALVLTVDHKSTCSEAYNLSSMLACGGMFHFKAVDLFRRYPQIKTAVVRPIFENDARNIVFVRDDLMASPLSITIQRALSRAQRSGFRRVVMPLLRFNWHVRDDVRILNTWARDYLQTVIDCQQQPGCQVPELVIVTADTVILGQLRRTLKQLTAP